MSAWNVAFEMGRQTGFEEGYADGFDAGHDVGAARILLHGPVPDFSPQYSELVALRAAGPCDDRACGACRVRREWLDRHGSDWPGRPVLRVVAS